MAMMATDQSSTAMIDQPHLAAPPKIPIPNDNQSRSTMDYSKFFSPHTMNNNSPSTTTTQPITLNLYLLHVNLI
uniref:Putative ovule protein n=1 Tax=Solanum chacoense TaxID=4108 RepID=A0A0V0H800_SOLCH